MTRPRPLNPDAVCRLLRLFSPPPGGRQGGGPRHAERSRRPGLRWTSPRRPATGFSLVEMLVIIAIITLLMSLIIVGGSKMKDNARSNHTRLILHSAMGIATDFEVTTNGSKVNHINDAQTDWTTNRACNVPGYAGANPAPIKGSDSVGSDNDIKKYSSERFVWSAWQYETLQAQVMTLGKNTLTDRDSSGDATDLANGFFEIRDDWGNKIIYCVSSTGGFLADHLTPFFVSAGPDGDFGDVRAADGTAPKKATLDNIYSYNLE